MNALGLVYIKMGNEADLGGAGGEAKEVGSFELGGELGGGAEAGLDAEDDDVGIDAVGLQGEAVGGFDGFGQYLCVGMVVFEALAVVLKSIEGAGGDDAVLPHGAAKKFSMAAGFLDGVFGAGEGGADRCAQALAEADADGIEVLTPFGFGNACCGNSIPEASAVEVCL